MKANDRQVAGDHYDKPIQVWDFITANKIDYLRGNIIKYLCRDKNILEDLAKAEHYLVKLREVERERHVIKQGLKGGAKLSNPLSDKIEPLSEEDIKKSKRGEAE